MAPPGLRSNPVVTGDDGRAVDSYADTYQSRANALASSGNNRAKTFTRTTAPPPDAVLTAQPINVALDRSQSLASPSLDEKPASGPAEEEPAAPARWAAVAPRTAASVAPAVAAAPAADSRATIRELIAAAREQIEAAPTYQVRLHRQERVGSVLQPEEDVVLSIRRQPRAVRLEWPDGPHKGREVIYVTGPQGNGLMHVNMNNALMPRLSLPPDSPLALQNSRHPITEAGLEAILNQIETALRNDETQPQAGREPLRYAGVEPAGAEQRPCHKVVRTTATGETWTVDFDAQNHLPCVIHGQSASGELLERYVFRDFKSGLPELAVASAFDPDARWGASRGLFGRLARSPDNSAANSVR